MIIIDAAKIIDTDAADAAAAYLRRSFGTEFADSAINKKNPVSRNESVTGLVLLDRILRRNGICPENLKFYRDIDRNGRPRTDACDIDFNISHSGEYAVCAVGIGNEPQVGIDIQKHIGEQRQKKLIGRFFAPDEAEYFNKNGESEAAFLSLWTRKEAYLKYTGKGISVDLRSVSTFGRTDIEFYTYTADEYTVTLCCRKDAHCIIPSNFLLNSSAVL